MSKRIGIVAVTPEGAALCYQTICAEGPTLFGREAHPEVTLHALPLADHLAAIRAGDWDASGALLLESAKNLQAAGADFLICPANTAHLAIDRIRDRSPLPWLHIAEEVAAEAERRGFRRLLLLGTRPTMEGGVYDAHLAKRSIGYETPEPADRQRVHDIILRDLVFGRFPAESREYVVGLIRDFAERGGDGVILGCTELPLLLPEGSTPIPALDSTRILARAALREAKETE